MSLEPNERARWRAELSPGPECPPLEKLAELLEAGEKRPPFQAHIDECAYCRTELAMLREFQSGEVRPEERASVEFIVQRLKHKQSELLGGSPRRESWWTKLWQNPWQTRSALVAAAMVLAVAVGIQYRRSAPPNLRPAERTDVVRSRAIGVYAPAGDLDRTPTELRWQSAGSASKYRVRVTEVDGNELWSAETTAPQVDLPAAVQARIVAGKTVYWEVAAFDGAGANIAASERQSFRVTVK
jgi:hypothetical protein